MSPDPIVCFNNVFKQRMVFATSFPKTRLWSLSGWDQWLTDNRELLSWSLRNITKIFRIPHLFPRQLYLQIITTDTMLSAFFFHGFFAGFPSSFVDGVSWVEYFKRVLVFNRCIFCSLQFRLTLQRMKHPGIKYYTLVLAYLFITISSFNGAWPKRLLKQARLTITYSSALRAGEYLFSFSVKRLDATQFRGGSRNFSPGGSKLWFGKDCWTFWWQITSQRGDHVFKFLNLWTPVAVGAGNTALRTGRTDHRRVPKNNYILEYPWNLV